MNLKKMDQTNFNKKKLKNTHVFSKVESKSRAFRFECLSVSHWINPLWRKKTWRKA
jgi:hypothetical protein